jgi:hypothetical protein
MLRFAQHDIDEVYAYCDTVSKRRGRKLLSLFPRPLGGVRVREQQTPKALGLFLLIQSVDVAALIQLPNKAQVDELLWLRRFPFGLGR